MKKVFTVMVVVALALALCAADAMAKDEVFTGLSFNAAQSTENSVKNTSFGVTGLLSLRPNDYLGLELQGGLFGKAGPFTTNAEVDLSGVGFLPLGSKFKLYGKAGIADVYSTVSGASANKLGLTYGAGVEYQVNYGGIRLGFQHFKVGNDTLSPGLSTNLIGISFISSR